MEVQHPPDEIKNIIDKLAQFVARNGPEFETMTKQKQKDNPKFSFLFGGEYFNYYQYRVTTEQAILKQSRQKQLVPGAEVVPPVAAQQAPPWQQTAAPPPPPGGPPPAGGSGQLADTIAQLQQQLDQQRSASQEQIVQSERNLAEHFKSLTHHQQIQIDEKIGQKREEKFVGLLRDCDVRMEELDQMCAPIIDSCTKDAISHGKNWIFSHNISQGHGHLIAEYLYRRIVSKNSPFETKLHLIYLINDVLHHCLRKNADDLRKALESIVIPVFSTSYHIGSDDKKQKLLKLLSLWEQNNYFDASTIKELRSPDQGASFYQASLIAQHGDIVQSVSAEINQKYSSLQQQHQEFVNHLNSQISQLEQQLQQQKQQLQQQEQLHMQAHQQLQQPPPQVMQPSVPPPAIASVAESINAVQPSVIQQPMYPGTQPGFGAPAIGFSAPPPPMGSQTFDYNHGKGGDGPPNLAAGPPPGGPPPGGPPPGFQLPDLSKPPPGFPNLPPPPLTQQPPPAKEDLMPSVPYYDLPAGLMAPLVKLEDGDYKPLNPKDIRLPPPQPPSDRLLAAVEAFYSPPSHERPRDSEGWEKLALYEFFRAKQKAQRIKEQERQNRSSSSSSSRSRSSSSSSSSSSSCSRSRSRSPNNNRRPMIGGREVSSSPEERRRSKSRSRSPPRRRNRRSRSRSASPPSFMEPMYQATTETRLGMENKGHQLLAKMGWDGGGLGAKKQGRMEPVEAADTRDNADKFKGLGMDTKDPFEQFRKNRAQTFIQRMQARSDT